MKSRFAALRPRKNLSVFFKILAFFLVICVLLTGLFSLFSARTLYHELEAQLYGSTLNLMALTDMTADILLDNLRASIRTASQNATIISAVIAPDITRSQRNYDVVHYLHATAESSALVSRILLYVDYDQTVFSSDGLATPLSSSLGTEAVGDHLARSGTDTVPFPPDGAVSFRLYRGRLYCCLDFPLEGRYRNGTLFYEVDQGTLYHELNSQTEYDVYIYNEENSPVFPAKDNPFASLAGADFAAMRTAGRGTLSRPGPLGGKLVYYYAAPGGWLYLYPVPVQLFSSILAGVVRLLLPMCLASLLLSILLSSYLSHAIYRPIRRLTALVSEGIARPDAPNGTLNELEFLGLAWQDAVRTNQLLQGVVSRSGDVVMGKLLRQVMLGREVEPGDVRQTIQALGMPFLEEGDWLALAVDITSKDGTMVTLLQTDLYKASLDTVMGGIAGDVCGHLAVSMEPGRIAMALCFTPQNSPRIAGIAGAMATAIRTESEQLPCGFVIGVGKVYHSLYDLQYSYRDAVSQLNYQHYTNRTLPPEQSSQAAALETDYAERAGQLAQALFALSPGSADLTRRVLDEFFAGDPTPALLQGRLETLVSALYGLIEDDRAASADGLDTREDALRRLGTLATAEAQRQWAEQLCASVAEYFSACNSRKKYRVVQRAREYVEEHFTDPNLSLNDAAHSLGITPTYLSRLFSEYQQHSFIETVSELRVRRAVLLLTTTDLPVSEIGFKCGFSSAQNFSRVFRKYQSVSPSQYRLDHMRAD